MNGIRCFLEQPRYLNNLRFSRQTPYELTFPGVELPNRQNGTAQFAAKLNRYFQLFNPGRCSAADRGFWLWMGNNS